jgi:hypothetical protein
MYVNHDRLVFGHDMNVTSKMDIKVMDKKWQMRYETLCNILIPRYNSITMKNELILSYQQQLKNLGTQSLEIPDGYVAEFWKWFNEHSFFFDSTSFRKKLRKTDIPIENNFCFKNSYRIAKGFVKRLHYFEGFVYSKFNEAVKHAFNVCNSQKVNDYSLINETDFNQQYYVGVKIPLTFARKIYHEKGDFKYSQESLLVSYFMYKKNIEGYLNYTTL